MLFEEQPPSQHPPYNDAEIVGYIDAEFSLPFLQAPVINDGGFVVSEDDTGRRDARHVAQPLLDSPHSTSLLPGDHPRNRVVPNTEYSTHTPENIAVENDSSMRSMVEADTQQQFLTGLQPADVSCEFLTQADTPSLNSRQEADQILVTSQSAEETLRADFFRRYYTPKGNQVSPVFPELSSIPSSTVTQDATCNETPVAQLEGPLVLPNSHPEMSSGEIALPGQSGVASQSGQYIADVIGQQQSIIKDDVDLVLHPEHGPSMQDFFPLCESRRTQNAVSFNDSAVSGPSGATNILPERFCVEDFLPEQGLGVANSAIRKTKGPNPRLAKLSLEHITKDFHASLEDDFAVLGTGTQLELQGAYQVPAMQPVFRVGMTKTTRKPRAKKEKIVQPLVSSKHCHICARSGHPHNLASCRNLHVNGCRKVVCRKCYNTLGATTSWEKISAPADKWECIHCQGMCPEKAQCVIYAKTNARRRDINLQKKKLAAMKAARKNAPSRSSKSPCARIAQPSGSSPQAPAVPTPWSNRNH